MSDQIIRELWDIKDRIAEEHGYDVEALVLHLRRRACFDARETVDLSAMRKPIELAAAETQR